MKGTQVIVILFMNFCSLSKARKQSIKNSVHSMGGLGTPS